MKRIFFFLLLCGFIVTSFSQTSSKVDFTIRNLGLNVEGYFKNTSITSKFDDQDNLIAISGEVEVNSIDTGIESRDEHLLESDYFNEAVFKTIKLRSIQVSKTNDHTYNAKVNLTIKGKTKAINIPIKVIKIDDGYKTTSNFEINRRDFNVGGGSFVMSKTVKVSVTHYHKN